MNTKYIFIATLVLFISYVSSQDSCSSDDDCDGSETCTNGVCGNSSNSTSFAGSSTINAAAIYNLAQTNSESSSNTDSMWPVESDPPNLPDTVRIKTDWVQCGAYYFIADMDVDCDGVDYTCPVNQDGQDATTFGDLSAYNTPFIVVPDDFYNNHQDEIPPNALSAVICNGQLFYGILGDTDGDTPEAIGEASWLMAQTCFPNDDLNGNNGHVPSDVFYAVFTGNSSVALSEDGSTIASFSTLQSMGDSYMASLQSCVGIGASSRKRMENGRKTVRKAVGKGKKRNFI